MNAAASGLRIDTDQQQPGTVVLRLIGQANYPAAAELQKHMDQVIDTQPQTIVLDLSELTFICSMALSAIIQSHLKVRDRKIQIRLKDPQPSIREVLEVTKLTKLFPIVTTDAAVA